jgi:hypothetical protein
VAQCYGNENLAFAIIVELRALGHDVLTSFESGRANRAIPDDQVLAYAHERSRIVITNNRRDYVKLHRSNAPHSGIVAYTFDPDATALAKRIDEVLGSKMASSRFLAKVDRAGHTFI